MKHKLDTAILSHWYEGQTCKGFQNAEEKYKCTQGWNIHKKNI